MVEQDVKKLRAKFGVHIQTDMYDDLFARRAAGEKIAINKAMENAFLDSPSTSQEKRIRQSIEKYRRDQIRDLEKELEKQKLRFEKAQKSLAQKPTKKAQEEIRIATNKIEQIKFKIKKIGTPDFVSEDEKSVFPMTYLSMITMDRNGEMIVAPFRYHMRPAGQPESFDRKYNGCYNARKDNLSNPFWKPVFGKRHGLLIVKKFYEHVPVEDYKKRFDLPPGKEAGKTIVLGFEPEGVEYMLIPTLWDVNRQKGKPDLYSCALITDEPPSEVAETGHNRCPIFLKEENIKEWLTPEGRSTAELIALLDDRETPYYRHALIGAA